MTARLAVPFLKDTLGKTNKKKKIPAVNIFTTPQCLTTHWSDAQEIGSPSNISVLHFPRFHSLPQQMLAIMCKLLITSRF